MGDQRIDNLGSAVLSTVPGFRNLTIGASNVNALAVNYGACQAPLTFTNGLRSPKQPSASNGAARFQYAYNISDGVSYWVFANITFTATSAFATAQDALGNPYQQLTGATGTRLYSYLPTGQQLLSTITGLVNTGALFTGDQRFYPYTLLLGARRVFDEQRAVPGLRRHLVRHLAQRARARRPALWGQVNADVHQRVPGHDADCAVPVGGCGVLHPPCVPPAAADVLTSGVYEL